MAANNDLLSIFALPLEIDSRMYDEEDLEEKGFLTILDGIEAESRGVLLEHARTLVSIKPELAYHFLFRGKALLEFLEASSLEKWVALVLDIFDARGLNPAKEFIFALNEHPVFLKHWGKGVSFSEIHGILDNYVNALGPGEFRLDTGPSHYTDTLTIYLPERISTFAPKRDNTLLYKIMVTHKFLQTELGTYRLNIDEIPSLASRQSRRVQSNRGVSHTASPKDPPLLRFLNGFRDPVLAEDLYNLMETIRIEAWIESHLPGLYREMDRLKRDLGLMRAVPANLPSKSRIMEHLVRKWLKADVGPLNHGLCEKTFHGIEKRIFSPARKKKTAQESADAVIKVYTAFEDIPGDYCPIGPVIFVGVLKPLEAEKGRQEKRAATRARFREELGKLLQDSPDCEQVEIEIPGMDDADPTLHRPPPNQQLPMELLMDGNPVPIPEAMRKTVKEIYEDLGAIPGDYVAMADDMSGHSFRSLCQTPTGTSNILSEHAPGVHVYDEWDYRRKGYRKRWVLLRESVAEAGDPAFSADVLDRYGGMIRSIKRQFERIQTAERLLKKQTEGDRVDLDAAVLAFADMRAGLTPSERVFSQVRRDRRDIATVFLIDLSGSTKGWINDMERTALLILSEAFQVLKDRFAIYGFSGRTRKRCELFRVKGFEEAYGATIRERISGLGPLDYTRMGPPIRHIMGILGGIEARTRLMMTLSDGKPDDYDIYKGPYGIEDTRQALLETRQAGIHPFCITIDRAEHSYLSHMYGPDNYVFIDDISRLPVKIPEIYRKLTT